MSPQKKKITSKIVKILKFGGSSVGSAERIKNVCRIIYNSTLSLSKGARIAVVVSAMQGVTDKLLALKIKEVKEIHQKAAAELKVPFPAFIFQELEAVESGARMLGDFSPMVMDRVASFGERLSAALVASYLHKKLPAEALDAREVVKTDNNFQNAAVDFPATNRAIQNYFKKHPAVQVITGFIGSTKDNKTTTLGRGGSDYSAAIFGAALGVEAIEIWTDANGILSADPRVVPEAKTLPAVSYEEAFEMAYFGAKVIHPATMVPAIKKSIPIVIKNTFNPAHSGTFIGNRKLKIENSGSPAKNISSLDGMALITVGGTDLAGVPGTAERVFRAAAKEKANIVLIAQASSEHTICFAVKETEAERAIRGLKAEFDLEIGRGKMSIEVRKGQSVVAVVGDGMRGVPGISGKIFDVLGKEKINVNAIAQGGSEKNISLVVQESDKAVAVQAVHRILFEKSLTPAIFIIGAGNVGGELLRQLNERIKNQELRIRICGIADSNKMHLEEGGIDLKNWKKPLAASATKMNLDNFLKEVQKNRSDKKVLVDCTASEPIAKRYSEFVAAGCDIVTPNKKANVLPMAKYTAFRKVLEKYGKTFHYQANVGAGLPVLDSVKGLVSVGDSIKKIEGIFSGTLSYLFNNFDGKKKFSELVLDAKAKGYTEPDPKEDLSGQDVGRKLLILARATGLPAELSEVVLENLAEYNDQQMANKLKKAKAKKCVLRYVGSVQGGRLSAKLKEIPLDNPLAHVSGADNIVAIYSGYYKNQPLVIKGPGAGAEVTAAAVLRGIIRAIQN